LSNILLRNLKIFYELARDNFFLARAKFSFFRRFETKLSLHSRRFPFRIWAANVVCDDESQFFARSFSWRFLPRDLFPRETDENEWPILLMA